MTLIKIYFVNTIKSTGQEVSRKLAERAQSETAIQALLYNKFVTLSHAVRPLMAELEHRSSVNPEELRALLSECHSAYISTRHSLLGAKVSDEVGRLDPRGSDLVDLVCAPVYPGLTFRQELGAATSNKPVWTSSTYTSTFSSRANLNSSMCGS
jgi:hypothetical protein